MEIQDGLLRVSEAARFIKISKQALHAAAQNGRIPVKRIYGMQLFSKNDLIEYKKNKYLKRSCHADKPDTEMSVKEAAIFLKCSEQKIYYFIRMKYLDHSMVGNKKSSYRLVRKQVEDLSAVINVQKKKSIFSRYFP